MHVEDTDRRAAIHSAVDAGSNSLHVLVAEVVGHEVRPLLDESVFLGLGSAVAATGEIGPEARVKLVDALSAYVDRARGLGSESTALLGTEPFRRARDAALAAEAVRRATGCPLEILDHEEEAQLTAIGAYGGRTPAGPQLVVDVGGGSTEFIALAPDVRPRAWGISVGSARLTEEHVRHDPLLPDEVRALRRAARSALSGVEAAGIQDVTAVGGTAGNLVKIVPEAAVDGLLTPERLDAALRALLAEPAASFGPRHLLNPRRTPLLPAGIAIVEAILAWAGVDAVKALDVGIREGAVLGLARAGEGWRERLPELVRGWP